MTTSAPAGTTRRLIEFALGLRYEDLPAEVVAKAKGAILDTLGVTLVGSREPTTQMVALTCVGAGREGDATVLGATARTTPAAAALLNGYAAHTTDYDDSQHPCGTHMSAPVLAATLATAEIHHRTGTETLTGYLAGFELGCKLGRIGDFGRVLQRRGVHPTGFLGRFGAAAAAGRLMSLNAGQMNHTMGIAAGQAAGVIRSFGSMCKAFNAGNAAHDGVQAGDQFLAVERLDQVIVGAEAQALYLLVRLGHAREDQDRRVDLRRAQLFQHVIAVHVRQVQVEDDNVVVIELAEVDAFLAQVGGEDVKAVGAQHQFDALRHRGIVFDQQHSHVWPLVEIFRLSRVGRLQAIVNDLT